MPWASYEVNFMGPIYSFETDNRFSLQLRLLDFNSDRRQALHLSRLGIWQLKHRSNHRGRRCGKRRLWTPSSKKMSELLVMPQSATTSSTSARLRAEVSLRRDSRPRTVSVEMPSSFRLAQWSIGPPRNRHISRYQNTLSVQSLPDGYWRCLW